MLAGVASAMHMISEIGAELVVGRGQGAVVATALARPRVVEEALFARAVSHEAGSIYSGAWHHIKARLSYAPELYGAAKAERVFEAVPSLFAPCMPGEDPHLTLVVAPKSGPKTFS